MRLEFKGVPTLETKRLRMRGYVESDFDAFAQMWADQVVVEHISGKVSNRSESWRKFMSIIGSWPLLGFGFWAVFEKTSDRFVGQVGFVDMMREIEPSIVGKPEAGWVLAQRSHGKGYATEAMKRALTWGLPQFGDVKPVCILDPDYAATLRVAEKCGFVDLARTNYHDKPCLIMELQKPELL